MKIIFLDGRDDHPKYHQIVKFSLGEKKVLYSDINSGNDFLLVQDLNRNELVGQKIFDLILFIKSLPAGSNVSILLPYLYYSRQDKEDEIALWIFLDLLSQNEVKELITFDIHNLNIIEKSPVKITNISITDMMEDKILNSLNGIVISPDYGGLFRASHLAKKLNLEYISCVKTKERNILLSPDKEHRLCEYKSAILIDDIFDSGQTILKTIPHLKKCGIEKIDVVVTHYYGGVDFIFPSDVSRVISSNFFSSDSESLFVRVNMVENYLNKIKSLAN